MESHNGKSSAIEQVAPIESETKILPPSNVSPVNSQPGVTDLDTGEETQDGKQGCFAYLKTRNFYIVLVLGQVLALCITGTNTFSSLLAAQPFSIPAFQTLWNYVLLNLVYTSYTIYRYGFKKYFHFILHDGWKYLILSFLDVEGNYFTVLAYRYTVRLPTLKHPPSNITHPTSNPPTQTILSAQLINFWAIVIVVLLSTLLLHVRYHILQIAGILICIGGVGILFGSDHITQGSGFGGVTGGNQLKGDLFALLGATFYGTANIAEEFLVSKRPLYEVVGQLGLWGMLISGAQTGIFDRPQYHSSTFSPSTRNKTAGYMTGYTLCLFIFYSGAPMLFRLASAAFFNISLLTGNFWGTVIGVKVFHLHIHWMYPIAFVCIVGGLVVYFVGRGVWGEARKPWLGQGQEGGVDGVGTARRRVERGDELAVPV
ncbi:hypothetical protein ACLMJK_002954 [Lecanora helva]